MGLLDLWDPVFGLPALLWLARRNPYHRPDTATEFMVSSGIAVENALRASRPAEEFKELKRKDMAS